MADTAFRTLYDEEWVSGLEDRESVLRKTVRTKGQVKGNQFVFLVAGSGGASAATRGADGMIPARTDDLTQNTATLVEYHDLPRKTSFTVDLSQADQRAIMQETSMGVLNRKIDDDIISILDSATIGTTVASEANINTVSRAIAELGLNNVAVDEIDNMFGLVTPAFFGALEQTAEWSSRDYVEMPWFTSRKVRMVRWGGVNWIRHSRLTGAGTGSAKCYIYHKDCMGHAMDKERVVSIPGYNEEQDYHWVRTSGWFGSVKLLDSAIVQILHDDSAYNLA